MGLEVSGECLLGRHDWIWSRKCSCENGAQKLHRKVPGGKQQNLIWLASSAFGEGLEYRVRGGALKVLKIVTGDLLAKLK
jgi:hypothetical protein